jgi:hypothetical protein
MQISSHRTCIIFRKKLTYFKTSDYYLQYETKIKVQTQSLDFGHLVDIRLELPRFKILRISKVGWFNIMKS